MQDKQLKIKSNIMLKLFYCLVIFKSSRYQINYQSQLYNIYEHFFSK